MDADLVVDYEHVSDLERRLREAMRLLNQPVTDASAELSGCGSSEVNEESITLDGSERTQTEAVREQVESLRAVTQAMREELRNTDEGLARAVQK